MAKKKDEALAVKENTAIANYDYGEDAGAGDEDQTAEDYVLPFLKLLQPLSPPVQDELAKYGQFWNTVTEEAYDDLEFVVCATEHTFVEWVPRKQGGGFRGKHAPSSVEVQDAKTNSAKFGEYYTDGGNDLIETFYAYILLLSGPDAGSGAILPFTSTKIKPYKVWNSKRSALKLPNGQKPPIFAHCVKMTSFKDKNDQGQFAVPIIEPAGGKVAASLLAPDDERMAEAKKFRELIKAGDAKIDYNSQNEGKRSGDDEDLDDCPL